MTPPSDRPPTLARELGARAQAIEHALEHAVAEQIEHGLHVAEVSIARRFGARAVGAFRLALRAIGWFIVLTFFAIGLTMLAARYWLLPRANEWRQQIEGIASDALQAPVRIGRIEASWRGLNPMLALSDVAITGQSGSAVLSLPRIEGTLSWSSVPALEPRFSRLRIYAPELAVTLLDKGRVSVAGFIIDPADTTGDGRALDWLLAQDGVVIRDARVVLRDERDGTPREIVFSDADLLLDSGLGTTRFGLQLAPPPAIAAAVDLRVSSVVRHSDGCRTSNAGAANSSPRSTTSISRRPTTGCMRHSKFAAPRAPCVPGSASMRPRWSVPLRTWR